MEIVDGMNKLQHVRLDNNIGKAVRHLLHVIEESPVHKFKSQVQLAVGPKAFQEGDQVWMVQSL